MAWTVELSEEADREIGKLDPQHAKRILKFLQQVARLDNPRSRERRCTGPGWASSGSIGSEITGSFARSRTTAW
jgi:hypothetical protein